MLGIAAYAIWRGMRGAWIRLAAAAALLVALANPVLLQSWVAVDTQGTVTQVDLTGIRPGVELDNKLFIVPRGRVNR